MNNKLEAISNLFEGSEIRSIWDSEKEEYYFCVIDVISILTGSSDPAHYWRTLKSRMIGEGNETVTNCDTFKLKAKDLYEKETKKSAISKSNSLNYKYIDEQKQIEDKEGEKNE